jgi:spermidine/putrescine transport system substrate-binding protein
MTMRLDRRQFNLMLGAGALAGAGLGASSAKAATTITVLNWQGYGTDEPWALKIFQEKTGIEVKHDYFNAESEMITKVQTNPGAYDVVLVNSGRVRQLTDGFIEAVDLAKFPNAKDLDPALKMHPNFVVDGKPYGVAWLWGMTAIGARKGKVGQDVSFDEFLNPKWKDRFAMNDDPIVAIALGCMMTGQDINAPKDLKAAAEKLKSLKPNVKLLWQSEDEWNKAFAADQFDISLYWSGAAVRSFRNSKLPVEFIVPKEGPIGWLDTLTIPTSSKNKEAAAAFINYMIDPGFYVEWATKVGAPASANAAAMNALPADDLNKIVHDAKYLKKMQINGPLPDDVRQSFVDTWTEVKAFYAK